MTNDLAQALWSFVFMSPEDKLLFVEYLNKHYKDYLEYVIMTNSERKVFAHHFERPARAQGYYDLERPKGDN